MQPNNDLIEKAINYCFENKDFLEVAFTHSSFANENKCRSNERLEFLGDSVLNFIVSVELFSSDNLTEGELSVLRAQAVSKKPLALAVERMDILKYLKLGEGIKQADNLSEKFKSNIFESVLGAIFLDGGLSPCKDFIKFALDFKIERLDYKTLLQEFLQAKKISWNYENLQNEEEFSCKLSINDKVYIGSGRKKKDAEQDAAKKAYNFLRST